MLLMLKSLDTTVGCSPGLLEVCCGKNVSTVCPFSCLCSFSDGEDHREGFGYVNAWHFKGELLIFVGLWYFVI